MFDIEDLKDKTVDEIVDLLLEQQSQPFEFVIPKGTQQFFSESDAVAAEYINLAYVGQRLHDISTSFDYSELAPAESGNIFFRVTTSNFKELAETLLEISYGYVNDSDDPEFIYAELVEDFLRKIENATIIPACPYLVQTYKEFSIE